MKIFFDDNRKRKRYSRIMGGFGALVFLYYVNVLKHNPFLNFRDMIFATFLVILIFSSCTLIEIVEDKDFFSASDRQKRFIASEVVKASILIICIVIIYIIAQLVQIQ